MGITFSHFNNSKMSAPSFRNELFAVDDDNGYIFCKKYYIPEELLSIILSYCRPHDLVFKLRFVCKTWCNVIDSQVWRLKLNKGNYCTQRLHDLPWFASYWILTKDPLNRNLVKNGCGEDKLQHWNLLSNGGDGWKVEKPPKGSEELPLAICSEEIVKNQSCFVTSFYSCTKQQIIDLAKEGAVPALMDHLQPHIVVSEWYAGRFDCTGIYELKVSLLDGEENPIDEFEIRKNVGKENGWSWRKVTHEFRDYGPGVRFVRILHSGKDSQFWKGWYGSKMTGASMRLVPSVSNEAGRTSASSDGGAEIPASSSSLRKH